MNILIADNHFFIAEGIFASVKKTEQVKLAKKAENKEELLSFLQINNFDLLIIDNRFFGFDTSQKIVELRNQYSDLKFLIITNGLTQSEVAEFGNSGVHNIILKSSGKDEFKQALDFTMKGKIYYSNEILELLLEQNTTQNQPKEYSLTNAEIEIVKLIATGLTTKQIAERKRISYHTVVTHRKNIFRKLSINSTSELILFAMKQHLIDTIEFHI